MSHSVVVRFFRILNRAARGSLLLMRRDDDAFLETLDFAVRPPLARTQVAHNAQRSLRAAQLCIAGRHRARLARTQVLMAPAAAAEEQAQMAAAALPAAAASSTA